MFMTENVRNPTAMKKSVIYDIIGHISLCRNHY